MAKATHKVLRNFNSNDTALTGKLVRGKKFDASVMTESYVKLLVNAGYLKDLRSKEADPVAGEGVKEQSETTGKSIGALDGSDDGEDGNVDPTEDDEEELESGEASAELDDIMKDEGINDDLEEEDENLSDDKGGNEQTGGEENPDGGLVQQEVISDNPITDRINGIPDGDKEGLKKVATEIGSEVAKNKSFDNMKREMLVEFEGK